MPSFLIDVNLPYRFSLWKSDDYIHQNNLDPKWSDQKIWEYTRRLNLTIVSKDADFSTRILGAEPPPKVIHIRLGNIKIQELHHTLNNVWKDVLAFNTNHKLINMYPDRMEAIK